MTQHSIRQMVGFGVAAALFAMAGAAFAQDWMAAAPEGKTVKLDNAHVRVIEGVVAPHQKEAVHTHPANLAYVMTTGKIRVSYVGGETVDVDAKAGDVLWSDPEGPHTLENLSDKPLRYLAVELKELPYQKAAMSK